jgi:hypothetical protein
VRPEIVHDDDVGGQARQTLAHIFDEDRAGHGAVDNEVTVIAFVPRTGVADWWSRATQDGNMN